MKMKMFILTLVLISMMFTIPVYAQDSPSIRVSMINQNPDPVRPGEYVTVRLRVENIGEGDAKNVRIEFQEQFPFSLDPGVSSIKEIGSLGSLQAGNIGVIVDYDIRVSRQAVEGKNKIAFSTWREGTIPITQEFDVDVRTLESGISIRSVKVEGLTPGKEGFIEINVENPSDSTISDLSLELNLAKENLPFAPSGSSATKTIRFIESNQISTFKFNLMTFSNAEIKAYQIPIKLSFYDTNNNLVQKEDIIGVLVSADTDLRFFIDSSELYEESKMGLVTLNVVNRGLIGVKLFDAYLKDTEDYEVISNNQVYVGRIDSDDFERADFTIKRKTNTNPINFEFEFQYKDANNNLVKEEATIVSQIYPAPKNGKGTIWIILIVVAIIGFIIYKKVKKRRN